MDEEDSDVPEDAVNPTGIFYCPIFFLNFYNSFKVVFSYNLYKPFSLTYEPSFEILYHKTRFKDLSNV